MGEIDNPLDKTGEVFEDSNFPSWKYIGDANLKYKKFICADCKAEIYSNDLPSFLRFPDKIKICNACASGRYSAKAGNPNRVFQLGSVGNSIDDVVEQFIDNNETERIKLKYNHTVEEPEVIEEISYSEIEKVFRK